MKSITFTICCFLVLNSFGGKGLNKSLGNSSHEFVKIYPQDDLEAGKCLIKGRVYQDNINGQALSRVLVSTLQRNYFAYTDSTGYYEMFISAEDTALFAYHSLYSEHVIWNYDFKQRHVYELNFYLVEDYNQIIVDKPVIYMYADQPLHAQIKFEPTGKLTFTYPEYHPETGWNVEVSEKGLQNEGKTYPYLFWESSTTELSYDKRSEQVYGQFIKTDTVTSFLENSLTKLGLNDIEKTDFITYWAPRLLKEDFAFVQFIVDEDYDKLISQMQISPEPDHMRRVFILFTPYTREQGAGWFKEQKLTSFERKGFTVVEWGGSMFNAIQGI